MEQKSKRRDGVWVELGWRYIGAGVCFLGRAREEKVLKIGIRVRFMFIIPIFICIFAFIKVN